MSPDTLALVAPVHLRVVELIPTVGGAQSSVALPVVSPV